MKLTKYFSGKFVNIFLKRPQMIISGHLVDEDEYFLYMNEEDSKEVSTAIPRNNVASVSLEDEIAFLMDKVKTPDGEFQ